MLASTPVNMALTKSVPHCISLNVSQWRGEDHRAWGDISAGIIYPAAFLLSWAIIVHFSSISRAQHLHVLFAVTFVSLSQEEELTGCAYFFLQ